MVLKVTCLTGRKSFAETCSVCATRVLWFLSLNEKDEFFLQNASTRFTGSVKLEQLITPETQSKSCDCLDRWAKYNFDAMLILVFGDVTLQILMFIWSVKPLNQVNFTFLI